MPAANATPSAASARPLQRSGVLKSPITSKPAVANSSGPVPNVVTWPTAPGRLATHSATIFIHSMPYPICRQNSASKPNGMASRPSSPIGITQAETIGMARRFAMTP